MFLRPPLLPYPSISTSLVCNPGTRADPVIPMRYLFKRELSALSPAKVGRTVPGWRTPPIPPGTPRKPSQYVCGTWYTNRSVRVPNVGTIFLVYIGAIYCGIPWSRVKKCTKLRSPIFDRGRLRVRTNSAQCSQAHRHQPARINLFCSVPARHDAGEKGHVT